MGKIKAKGPSHKKASAKQKKKSVFQVGKVTKKSAVKHPKSGAKASSKRKTQEDISKVNLAYDDIRKKMTRPAGQSRKIQKKLPKTKNAAASKVDLEKTMDQIEMLCRTKIDIAK